VRYFEEIFEEREASPRKIRSPPTIRKEAGGVMVALLGARQIKLGTRRKNYS
jgi:hypothetical protein